MMDPAALMARFPIRPPLRFVEGIEFCDPPNQLTARLVYEPDNPNVRAHERVFAAVPGVLVLEGLAQATGLLVQAIEWPVALTGLALGGIHRARFRYPVRPGQPTRAHVRLLRLHRITAQRLVLVRAIGHVFHDTETVARATATLSLRATIAEA